MIKKIIKSQNNTNNKKSSVFKNIVSKFNAKNKSTLSNLRSQLQCLGVKRHVKLCIATR